MSTEDALRLVRAAAADLDTARDRFKAAEAHRDGLVATFLGQGDMPTKDLAAALGLTTGRLYQIASREAIVASAGSSFDALREDSELAAAFAAAGWTDTITPENRLRVQ